MIRYVGIYQDKDFNIGVEKTLNRDVLILSENPPDVPYVKIEITIKAKEERFKSERKEKQQKQQKIKKRWFLFFGKRSK